MRAIKLSRWLWLAIICDVPIIVFRLWDLMTLGDHPRGSLGGMILSGQIQRLAALWGPWLQDVVISVGFFCLGLVGIVMAITGDSRPLLSWNLCYIAILIGALFKSPAPVVPVLIAGLLVATIGTYIGHRQMAQMKFSTEANST